MKVASVSRLYSATLNFKEKYFLILNFVLQKLTNLLNKPNLFTVQVLSKYISSPNLRLFACFKILYLKFPVCLLLDQ